MLGCEKAVFGQKVEQLDFGTFLRGRAAAQTLFFTMNSYDFYTQTKCTFWLHFDSIWDPDVPKTLFVQ